MASVDFPSEPGGREGVVKNTNREVKEGGSDRDHAPESDQENAGEIPERMRSTHRSIRRSTAKGAIRSKSDCRECGFSEDLFPRRRSDLGETAFDHPQFDRLVRNFVAMAGGVRRNRSDHVVCIRVARGLGRKPEGPEDLTKATREDQIDPHINRSDGLQSIQHRKQIAESRGRQTPFLRNDVGRQKPVRAIPPLTATPLYPIMASNPHGATA